MLDLRCAIGSAEWYSYYRTQYEPATVYVPTHAQQIAAAPMWRVPSSEVKSSSRDPRASLEEMVARRHRRRVKLAARLHAEQAERERRQELDLLVVTDWGMRAMLWVSRLMLLSSFAWMFADVALWLVKYCCLAFAAGLAARASHALCLGMLRLTASARLCPQRSRLSGTQETCAVCLEDFCESTTAVEEQVCGHLFHPHCIEPWKARQGTCPLCKQAL
jgi:hypothetical protein